MKRHSIVRRLLAFSLASFGCSSPSEPPLPVESHHLVISGENALLAISDSGGAADTLAVLEEASSIRVHEVSPDGQSAAVLARLGFGFDASYELYLVAIGGSPTSARVSGYSGSISWFSWSPDSRRLVFSTRFPSEIMSVGLDGLGLDTLVTLPLAGENPHWSPSGDRIVYTGWDTRVSDLEGLWTVRPDGSEARRIAYESVFVPNSTVLPVPRLSPSGEWIAFESSGELHVIRTDGTGRRQLTATPGGDEWHFRWSPRGDRIAYVVGGGARHAIRIMSFPEGAPVGGVEYDQESDRDALYPEWSPDGERIAFMSAGRNAPYSPPGDSPAANARAVATARGDEFSSWATAPLPVVVGDGHLPQWWPGH